MSSSTGGYLLPTDEALPGGLTLLQFLQQAFVGISGMTNTTIRPKFQTNPPKELPNPEDNWMAFAVTPITPDANAYVEMSENGLTQQMQRHEALSVQCSFYGPAAETNASKLRDGFQLSQNRDVLRTGLIGFTGSEQQIKVPELHGGVWFNRVDVTIVLTRQINRSYAVEGLISSIGTIEGLKDNNEIEDLTFTVEET